MELTNVKSKIQAQHQRQIEADRIWAVGAVKACKYNLTPQEARFYGVNKIKSGLTSYTYDAKINTIIVEANQIGFPGEDIEVRGRTGRTIVFACEAVIRERTEDHEVVCWEYVPTETEGHQVKRLVVIND